jgi:AraC-like DNA-binding protein
MHACFSVEQFLAKPLQSYLGGPTYLVWCSASDLGGTIVWGEPNEDDVRVVTRAWEFDRTVAPGFCSLVDFTKLRRVEPSAFGVAMEFCRGRVASFDPAMKRRTAVIHPRGVLGAVVAGVFPLLEPQHPWRLFETEAAAFAWSGCDDPEGLRAQLEEIVARLMNLPPIVRRLRDWLPEHVVAATVGDAARALGHSRRSLQRALEYAGSGFREELARARLSEAARLLTETDLKVEAVACRVGYSHAQLTRIVRRALGKTPVELRRPSDPSIRRWDGSGAPREARRQPRGGRGRTRAESRRRAAP